MFSLTVLVLAAIPMCEDSNNVTECSKWMANDMAVEQVINPGHDIGYYLECAVERAPEWIWRE
jgi:hypothetical protein